MEEFKPVASEYSEFENRQYNKITGFSRILGQSKFQSKKQDQGLFNLRVI